MWFEAVEFAVEGTPQLIAGTLFTAWIFPFEIISILLIIIAISFIINRNYLTPKINNFRDKELEGDKKASSSFKYMHLLSVLLFILNFIILVSIVIINYFNYNL